MGCRGSHPWRLQTVHPWTPWGYDLGGPEVGWSEKPPRFEEVLEISDGVELGDTCRHCCTGDGADNHLQSMNNLVFGDSEGMVM